MFNLREFIKKGLISAIGKMADYQVILNATGWYEKNVLHDKDLAEMSMGQYKNFVCVEPANQGDLFVKLPAKEKHKISMCVMVRDLI